MLLYTSHIRPVLSAVLICFAIGTARDSSGAEPDTQFVPIGTLVENATESLPLSPSRVVALDEDIYVVGTAGDVDQILHLDSTTLEVLDTFELSFLPTDAIVSFDGQFLYLVGERDGAAQFLILSRTLEEQGSLEGLEAIAHPSLSEAQNGVLVVGGMQPGKHYGVLFAVDVSDPAAPAVIPDLLPDDYNLFGVAGAWMDNRDEKTVFLNTALSPALVAFGIGEKGTTEYADISFDDKSGIAEPLRVLAFMPGRLCRSDEISKQASFLMSSALNRTLFLATFDPYFASLDLLAKTQISLQYRTPVDGPTYADPHDFMPTTMLVSSCDQNVIWIANETSTEIEQFSVNPASQSLEKVGQISLGYLPTDISIATSGSTAFVISSGRETISRFESDGGEVSGTPAARDLQRLLTERGYPVGAIDGQIGAMTLGAVKRFEDRNNLTLDVQGDLEGAIKQIQDTPTEW